MTNSAAVASAVEAAIERFGKLDVTFANAGRSGAIKPIVEYPEDEFDRVIAVNVKGVFLTVKHSLAAMSRGASIVINSSVVGLTADPGIAGYATSKHAVVGLMRVAAKEGASRGIRVNSIHPGPVDNEFQHDIEVRAIGASRERVGAGFRRDDSARATCGREGGRDGGAVPGVERVFFYHRDDVDGGWGDEDLKVRSPRVAVGRGREADPPMSSRRTVCRRRPADCELPDLRTPANSADCELRTRARACPDSRRPPDRAEPSQHVGLRARARRPRKPSTPRDRCPRHGDA